MKLLKKRFSFSKPQWSPSSSSSIVNTKICSDKVTSKDETSHHVTLYKGFNYEVILPHVPFVTTPSTETKMLPSDTVQDLDEEYEIEVLPKKQERKLEKRKIIEQPPHSRNQTWMKMDSVEDLQVEAEGSSVQGPQKDVEIETVVELLDIKKTLRWKEQRSFGQEWQSLNTKGQKYSNQECQNSRKQERKVCKLKRLK